MLYKSKSKFLKIYKNLGIKENDTVLLYVNTLKLLLLFKRQFNNQKLKLEKLIKNICEDIIGDLQKTIGKNGTILIPTYNWGFCRGENFDYYKTPSTVGALSNYALKSNDFKRTKNPIYSFAVYGKDKNKLCNMNHKSCFSLDSPFGHLIKKKGKNVFIGFDDFREVFQFPYVAEEKVGVNYRQKKEFIGKYIKDKKITKKYKVIMNVRDLKKNMFTTVDKNLKNLLLKKNSYKEIKKNNVKYIWININEAYKIMLNDISSTKKIVYPKKLNEL
jgi:aminoglycoside 3-N-acetyltransferase